MYRKHLILLTVLLAFGMAAQTFAAGTPAGTHIYNRAYGGYSDANGNVIANVLIESGANHRIESDQVETIVSQVYGVDIVSPQSKDLPRNQSVAYGLTVTNTGNGTDTFSLSQVTGSSGSSAFAVHIYHDTDNDDAWDGAGTEPEVSTTSALAADAPYNLVVVVSVTDGAQSEVATTTVTAESQGDGSKTDASVLTSTVQAALITGGMTVDNATPAPGATLLYTLTFRNSDNTNSDIAHSTVVTLPTLPANFSWGGTVTKDGGPISDPGAGGTIDFVNLDPDATDHTVTFTVVVNTGAPNGATFTAQANINYKDGTEDPYTPVNVSAPIATVNKTLGLSTIISPATKTGNPGDVIRYLVTVTNTGNGDDSFTISNFSSTLSWTWTFYRDDGNDGAWGGSETPTSSTGTVSSGGFQGMWAVAMIPPGTGDAEIDASGFRFTASGGGTGDQTGTTTVTAPVLSLDKAVDPPIGAGAQPPGTTLTYTVAITNSGTGNATNVIIKDAVPTVTTYVSGSMLIGSTPQTDGADSPTDESSCDGINAVFGVGPVAAGATVTVHFQVKIN
jgi:uncharacterized repeat protein (TIGR01451 family)